MKYWCKRSIWQGRWWKRRVRCWET